MSSCPTLRTTSFSLLLTVSDAHPENSEEVYRDLFFLLEKVHICGDHDVPVGICHACDRPGLLECRVRHTFFQLHGQELSPTSCRDDALGHACLDCGRWRGRQSGPLSEHGRDEEIW